MALSLQSLARLGVVRLGQPYPLPPYMLKYYSLWWAGVGPIYGFEDGVEPKLRIGDDVYLLNDVFIYAACKGNLGLTELCKELGAGYVNAAMAEAAKGGHIDIVRLCHDGWGATDVDTAMYEAAAGGHIDIMRLCHSWDATDINHAMVGAARNGHETIVRLCHSWGADDVNWAMDTAATGGRIYIVRLCHEWGATDVNWAMACAATAGHIDIVQLCLEWGATNVNDAMVYAARNGHVDIVRLCHNEWGADAVDMTMHWAMYWAAREDQESHEGHQFIVQLCLEWGAMGI